MRGAVTGSAGVTRATGLTRAEAYALARAEGGDLPELMEAARALAARRRRPAVTYSRSVFIPLTNICRDRCGYCVFRKDPGEPGARIMSRDEVRRVVEAGARAGCQEVLFSLGDKPDAFPAAREELRRLGHRTILEYLAEMCRVVVEEFGLFPHTNAGVIGRGALRDLRPYNLSMGLMVENISPRLCGPGGPHEDAPDKLPERRMRVLDLAGELRIPFTTGLLVGIGETPEERVDTLFAIREAHERHGQIQEVIVQNFRAKPGTPMALHPEPGAEEYLRTACLARLILGAEMNIQAPPNLNPGELRTLLRAGVNDWGGVSPLTLDYINPEAPWPQLDALREETAREGLTLRERLPTYPEFLLERDDFVAPALLRRARAVTGGEGYVAESP